MLNYYEHLELVKTQFKVWWRRENTKPLLYVPARWPKAADLPAPPENPRAVWLDAETILERERAAARHVYWGGIAFPVYTPYPPTAGLFGGRTIYTTETIWHEPVWAEAEKPYKDLAFDASHPDWLAFLGAYGDLLEKARGEFHVSMPNFYSPLDLLESLRGGVGLGMDLIDIPDEVCAAQEVILTAWRKIYDQCYGLRNGLIDGTCASFLPAWSPGRAYTIQCDFCCMISAEHFEKFVVPEVVAQAEWVDHSLFHLDGPGAARHADSLIRIPELEGIQWQKGVNGGNTLDWLPLLKKIQAGGKAIMVDCRPDEVAPLCEALRPEGLFVGTCCDTPEESEELIARINRCY
jgi:hypothetical protein